MLCRVWARTCRTITSRVPVVMLKTQTFNERARGIRLGWEVLRYAFTRKGLLMTAPGNVSASIKVMPGVATPDVQLAFAPASYVEGKLGVWMISPV